MDVNPPSLSYTRFNPPTLLPPSVLVDLGPSAASTVSPMNPPTTLSPRATPVIQKSGPGLTSNRYTPPPAAFDDNGDDNEVSSTKSRPYCSKHPGVVE